MFQSIFSHSQVSLLQNYSFGEKYDGGWLEYNSISTIDVKGNYIIAGNFDNYCTSPKNDHTGKSNPDFWIEKIDVNNKLVWSFTSAQIGYNEIYGMKSDRFNNIYLYGVYSQDFDADLMPGTNYQMAYLQSHAMFITKLTENGTFLWAKPYFVFDFVVPNLIFDENENPVFISNLSNITTFENSKLIDQDHRITTLILNKQDGSLISLKNYDEISTKSNLFINTDKDNNITIFTDFTHPLYIDGKYINPIGNQDLIAFKYDKKFKKTMQIHLRKENKQELRDYASDSDNNHILLYRDINEKNDTFFVLEKYSNDLKTIIWSKFYNKENINDISISKNGDIFLVGDYKSREYYNKNENKYYIFNNVNYGKNKNYGFIEILKANSNLRKRFELKTKKGMVKPLRINHNSTDDFFSVVGYYIYDMNSDFADTSHYVFTPNIYNQKERFLSIYNNSCSPNYYFYNVTSFKPYYFIDTLLSTSTIYQKEIIDSLGCINHHKINFVLPQSYFENSNLINDDREYKNSITTKNNEIYYQNDQVENYSLFNVYGQKIDPWEMMSNQIYIVSFLYKTERIVKKFVFIQDF